MTKSLKIMIAEDSEITQKVTKFMLEKHGFEIITQCFDGECAVKMFKTESPDIVLMDIAMPKMDGIQAIKKIMKINENAKIIIISAIYSQRIIEEAMDAGAKDFVVKPYEISELLKSIEKCINS